MLNNLGKAKISFSNKHSTFSTSLHLSHRFPSDEDFTAPLWTTTHPARDRVHRLRSLPPYAAQMSEREAKDATETRSVRWQNGCHRITWNFRQGCSFVALSCLTMGSDPWSGSGPMPRAIPTVVPSWWKQDWLLIPSVHLFPNDNKMLTVHFPSNWAAFTLSKITFN